MVLQLVSLQKPSPSSKVTLYVGKYDQQLCSSVPLIQMRICFAFRLVQSFVKQALFAEKNRLLQS